MRNQNSMEFVLNCAYIHLFSFHGFYQQDPNPDPQKLQNIAVTNLHKIDDEFTKIRYSEK